MVVARAAEVDVTFEEIEKARQSLGDAVIRTPLVHATRLSRELGCELYLKLENLQITGAFKVRGALVKLKSLAPEQAERGVIAMSAGNHAQGVAHFAQQLGIPATIVMPEFAPFSKIERTRQSGARVVLTGDTLDASATAARAIAEDEGLAFVHPYDDPAIIAGQGTIGLEMLDERPDLDCLVVPIGGGGLISGIATAAKHRKPDIEVVGVESALYPSMLQAIRGETPTFGGQTLADGIAVKNPGRLTKPIIERLVGEILLVDELAVETAIQMLVERQKVVAEGAGAAGLSAVLTDPGRFAGRKVGVVICGGNIDLRLLSGILSRGLMRDGRLARLRVLIDDRPGILARVARIIGETGGNIIEVAHQRMFYDIPPKQADLDLIVETRNAEHVQEILHKLQDSGLPTQLLSARSSEG